MEFEIFQIVFSLERSRMTQAGLANVDSSDPGIRLAQRISGCLRRATAGNEDLPLYAQRFSRPQEMKQRPTAIRILVKLAVPIQAGERRRIRHPLVKALDLFGVASRCTLRLLNHFEPSPSDRSALRPAAD